MVLHGPPSRSIHPGPRQAGGRGDPPRAPLSFLLDTDPAKNGKICISGNNRQIRCVWNSAVDVNRHRAGLIGVDAPRVRGRAQ
ncbi:hypothetical protein D187_000037 [Cystobacter fuscus DSM 2262]|uniref:Uncharacterized protein n=1 Tax=Cystobacter fuscus (strain ATCC 25194 / DSM 2262 / NBRC 100088 / M29) TaxID=1242864 RepID=S9PK66_CYSF2|nr:hypothetical protein D187_000037 [Cystobacter fuscus DSM 2262]